MALRLVLLLIVFSAGWYGGARFGAPAALINGIDTAAGKAAGAAGDALQDRFGAPIQDADEPDTDEPAPVAEPTPGEDATGDASGEPPSTGAVALLSPVDAPSLKPATLADGALLKLCRMQVSNPPRATGGVVGPMDRTATIGCVEMLLAPATEVCLSSGFGTRDGRMHRGVDYYRQGASDVLAAADGVVVEIATRDDYGRMLVVRHADRVFTRYAHLAAFDPAVAMGADLKRGQRLGSVGQSGAAGAPHLHFEVLEGAYVAGVGSFGIKAIDPYAVAD